MKKKVLHIIWNANFGGIEKLVYDLATEQSKKKSYEVTVLIAKGEGEFLNRFKKSNFKLILMNVKNGWSLSVETFKTLRNLYPKYDLLHFHFFNPFLISPVLFQSKIVYTEHGNFGFGREKTLSDVILNRLKKYFLNRKNIYLTFNSEFTKRVAVNNYFNQVNENKVVYNGIDFEESKTINRPLSDISEQISTQIASRKVIGTSSRFAGFKRIDRLISAFSALKEKEDVVLLLVGDGVLLKELKKQVAQLNLTEHVIFTGFVDQVRAVQNLMDVCVFPSAQEPFGLAAIETLSIGKPTIVFSDGGGLTEIIKKIEPQNIVSDESDLTLRLKQYLGNPSLLNENKENRILCAQSFTIEKMAKELDIIYNQVT